MNPETWMGEALLLAQKGRGFVEPNPRVGALALRGETVVGKGFHRVYGGPHAEVEAIHDAEARGHRPDGVVVTLEPCSAHGKKTPPCTEFLLSRGIRRVIVGARDPDPRHAGRGLVQLREAGFEVVEGIFAREALAENRAFLRALTLDRPWTAAKWAMTLDGKAATRTGSARWISSPAARTMVHQLRAAVDAVVIGMGTVLADDPRLTVRRVRGDNPLRIVVDPEAALPEGCQLLLTARAVPLLLLVGQTAACEHLERQGAKILRVRELPRAGTGHRRLDLGDAWRQLYRGGLRRVLVEGGGRLLAELVAASCLDQVYAFVAAKLVGGRSAPTPMAGEGVAAMDQALVLTEQFHQWIDGDLLLGGFVDAG
jgi:diaminohydroxyphosphoribosylaminopyrimidine deaminase/5-amino-6-(5-phosphoribosylamino)uracil reductase